MSVPVDLAALEAEIARFGDVAFLVTSSGNGRPHVVSVSVAVTGGELSMPAGRTSRRNATDSPTVTVLWPGPPDGAYCLLVDGTARLGGEDAESVVVTPTGAILHRRADGPTDLPSCVPVDRPS